jgi:hypothetical protein
MIIFEPEVGIEIADAIAKAIQMANVSGEQVKLSFNGTSITVHFSYCKHLIEEYEALRDE